MLPRKIITEKAYNQGSKDNLTVQIVRIDGLPDGEAGDFMGQASDLPAPPLLEARMEFDGYRSCAKFTPAAAVIFIWRKIWRMALSPPSRFHQWTCATTLPI